MKNELFIFAVPFIFLAALFVLQMISIRILKLLKKSFSNQTLLILLEFGLNIPLLIYAYQLNVRQPMEILISNTLYMLIVYNGPAYFYFHIFNMSDTARRIKIITSIKTNKDLTLQDLKNDYQPENLVENRLQRLLAMKQIKEITNGNYVINNYSLLIVSRIIDLWKYILNIKNT